MQLGIDTDQYIEDIKTSRETCLDCSTRCRNKRGCLIQQFVNAINRERSGGKYKPVTWSAINGKLSFMQEQELYAFLNECKLYNGSFGKRFYGGFKKQSWQK